MYCDKCKQDTKHILINSFKNNTQTINWFSCEKCNNIKVIRNDS